MSQSSLLSRDGFLCDQRRPPRGACVCHHSWVFAVLLIWQSSAHAQAVPARATPSLAQMVTTLRGEGVYAFDALEYDAAVANDAAYAALLPICAPTPTTTTAACTGTTQALFSRLRELKTMPISCWDRANSNTACARHRMRWAQPCDGPPLRSMPRRAPWRPDSPTARPPSSTTASPHCASQPALFR